MKKLWTKLPEAAQVLIIVVGCTAGAVAFRQLVALILSLV